MADLVQRVMSDAYRHAGGRGRFMSLPPASQRTYVDQALDGLLKDNTRLCAACKAAIKARAEDDDRQWVHGEQPLPGIPM